MCVPRICACMSPPPAGANLTVKRSYTVKCNYNVKICYNVGRHYNAKRSYNVVITWKPVIRGYIGGTLYGTIYLPVFCRPELYRLAATLRMHISYVI